MSDNTLTRRRLLGSIGAVVTGSSLAQAQRGAKPAPATAKPKPVAAPAKPLATTYSGPRVAPVDELVLVREFEDNARLKLPPDVFSRIEGTEHQGFDRITLRPRMMIPTLDMDLSVTLFGDQHFTPILIGPVHEQNRYHPDAELATVRGAAAGKAAMVVSNRSSVPIEKIAAEAKTPLWYQVWAEAEAKAQIQGAVKAGVRAVVVTLGAPPAAAGAKPAAGPPPPPDGAAIDGWRQGLSVPMLVKGITTPAEAKMALQHGVQGIIVSNWRSASKSAPILALASIVDAVGGKVPVLLDGSIRYAADIVKALAFGAQAVLIARPAMWGLGAYGAAGVQAVIEMLQSDLARTMGMMGNSTPKSLTRQAVRLHATATE
jgi:4-hydroxymandelate oxidase